MDFDKVSELAQDYAGQAFTAFSAFITLLLAKLFQVLPAEYASPLRSVPDDILTAVAGGLVVYLSLVFVLAFVRGIYSTVVSLVRTFVLVLATGTALYYAKQSGALDSFFKSN